MNALSIHPRNWLTSPHDRCQKSNTSRARSEKTTKRVIAGIERHLKSHPNDAASERHLSKVRGAS